MVNKPLIIDSIDVLGWLMRAKKPRVSTSQNAAHRRSFLVLRRELCAGSSWRISSGGDDVVSLGTS